VLPNCCVRIYFLDNLLLSTEKEPNILPIEEPLTIVGDIHGQYYDLLHMFEKAGDPDE